MRVIIALVVVVGLILLALAFKAGAGRRSPVSTPPLQIQILELQAEYAEKAAKASAEGKDGVANIYTEMSALAAEELRGIRGEGK